MPEQAQVAAQKALCSGLGDPTPGLGAAAALSLGHAGLRTPLRLPEGQPPSSPDKAKEALPTKVSVNGAAEDVEMEGAEEGAGGQIQCLHGNFNIYGTRQCTATAVHSREAGGNKVTCDSSKSISVFRDMCLANKSRPCRGGKACQGGADSAGGGRSHCRHMQ